MCAHFRSHDKDDGHAIRSAVAENPMLHTNFMALCFSELQLLPIKVLHCGLGIFDLFCSCDLDLDPITSYTNLTHIPWRYTGCADMNFLRRGFRKLLSDRQTGPSKIIYRAASWVVNNNNNSSLLILLHRAVSVSCNVVFNGYR